MGRGGGMFIDSCPSWAAGSEHGMVASESGRSFSSGSGNLLESKPLVELIGGKLADVEVEGRGKSLGYAGTKVSGLVERRTSLTL
jgi:hypothetical protein